MKLPIADAIALAARVLEASNVSPANARCVAQALVAADADGLPSHGLSRLAIYAAQAACGKVDGHAVPQVARRARASVQVDARDGFAFPALAAGLALVSQIVAETGVAALAIANSHHCGVAGHHVEWLAARGLVGLMFANTPGEIAPWGGSKASFGTNPVAFAAPRAGKPPLVVDLSLSKVARGKIMLARQKGEAIPEGWALDRDGAPTTDPDAALAGTMLPMGDAKGAALALVVEILAATITGSHHAYEASSFLDAKGPPPRAGQLVLALDPAAFGGGGFAARIEALLAHMLAQPGTRLPGDRRLAARLRAQSEGIEVAAEIASRDRAAPGTGH